MPQVNQEELMKMQQQQQPTSESGAKATNEPEFDALSAINDIKANMVTRDEYNKVVAEKNKYLKALVNGTQEPTQEPKKLVNLEELREQLFGSEKTNWEGTCKSEVEFVGKLLELRNETIEQEGWDPMAGPNPNDKYAKFLPSDDDYAAAQEFVDYTSDCLEQANGDGKKFAMAFGSGLVDSSPNINPKLRR